MKLRGQPTHRTRLWAIPSAALALLLLTGCGQLSPGTAAEVNGTRITNDEVDDLADAQCLLRVSLVKAQQAPVTSASRVKQESLELLIDVEKSAQFGRSKSIAANKDLASSLFSQYEPFFKPVPAGSRDELSRVYREWARGQAILVEAGSAATGQPPSQENLQQLLTAGLAARAAWLKKVDIEVDPRFAPDKDGRPGGGDGSVSKAASVFAKGGAADEQDAKWVASLPASQKCG